MNPPGSYHKHSSASKDSRIAVIGLGYVGLPLAHAFANLYDKIGFDINERRVIELKRGFDSSNELIAEQFEESINLEFSDKDSCLQNYDIYIITAPTPVDGQHQPHLELVKKATRLVASHLQMGNIVIFESTVYPGATEEECAPLLSEISGLSFNTDFHVGYSP